MRAPVKRMKVYEKLKGDINRNIFPPGSFLPNEIELAHHYSVGRKTMRGALAMLVDEQRVERMGLKGTLVCDLKKCQKTKVIGVVGIDNESPMSQAIISILDQETEKHGYHVVNVECNYRFISEHPEYLANFPADGLVFTGSNISNKLMNVLSEREIPLVGVCRMENFPDLDWMENNHQEAVRKALEYLMSLGHRRIAYIDFDRVSEYQCFIDMMRDIFKDVLKDDYDENLFFANEDINFLYGIYGEDYDYENCKRALKTFMAQPILPTAIVSSRDNKIELTRCLNEYKFHVPMDMSILMISENKQPDTKYTRIEFNREKRLIWATHRLIEILQRGKHETKQEYCDYQLIIGDTTGLVKS